MKQTQYEIHEQYHAMQMTIDLFDRKRAELEDLVRAVAPRAVLFTGCGSSFSLSCSFRSIASMRMKTPVYAVAAGDLWLNCVRYRNMLEGALVISVSRSGRTSEVVKAYEAVSALGVGARFLSIICAEDTPLEEISDATLKMPWAFDESVCQTRCVSNLYAMGAMVVGLLSGDDTIRAGITRMADLGDGFIEKYEPVAEKLAAMPWDHVVVLADGEIDGIAEEGALAYREISQLNSNYYHLLDVRHGPMVLFGKKTLVLANVKAPECPYEMALVDDAIKTGAIVVCYSQTPVEKEGAVCVCTGGEVGYVAAGLGLVALCQMISYHKSRVVGCDPDNPGDLKPWIEIK